MRRKDHRPVVRNLIQLIDEYRSHVFQPINDEPVVYDFMANVDGRSEPLERELHDLDCAIDAGAKAARCGNEQSKLGKFRHGAGHVRHRLQA